jgi:hypothetical protein
MKTKNRLTLLLSALTVLFPAPGALADVQQSETTVKISQAERMELATVMAYLAESGDFAELEKMLEPDMAPTEFGRLSALAMTAHSMGVTGYAQAREQLQAYVRSELANSGYTSSTPDRFRIWYQLGLLEEIMGNPQAALDAFLEAQKYATNANLRAKIVRLSHELGKGVRQ